jgi:hypothetical protein
MARPKKRAPSTPEERLKELLDKVQIVSDEEAENVDMVVCLPDSGPRYFDDDVTTSCAWCGIPIRHRPYVPKRPPKVCIHCASASTGRDKGKLPQDELGWSAFMHRADPSRRKGE